MKKYTNGGVGGCAPSHMGGRSGTSPEKKNRILEVLLERISGNLDRIFMTTLDEYYKETLCDTVMSLFIG